MSGVKNIVAGHINELLGNKEAIALPRLLICKKCPLYKKTIYGYVCNGSAWLNPKTGDFSLDKKDDYVKGCGCRIYAKVTVANEQCPAGKW